MKGINKQRADDDFLQVRRATGDALRRRCCTVADGAALTNTRGWSHVCCVGADIEDG